MLFVHDHGSACRIPGPDQDVCITTRGKDRRADGHMREVMLTRTVVQIDRSLSGISMRLAVPVQAYRGVALTWRQDPDGRPFYRLSLVHTDQELSVSLAEASDDRDILADWRLWSRFFGLPALVERRVGEVEEADAALGNLLLGGGDTARRSSLLGARHRPRFLVRRKPGRSTDGAAVFVGEREIIARH